MLLARSKMPTAGFVTALEGQRAVSLASCEQALSREETHPTRPIPTPLKKPEAPPDSAPSSGLVCESEQRPVSESRAAPRWRGETNRETLKAAGDARHEGRSARRDAVQGVLGLVAELAHAPLALVLLVERRSRETCGRERG